VAADLNQRRVRPVVSADELPVAVHGGVADVPVPETVFQFDDIADGFAAGRAHRNPVKLRRRLRNYLTLWYSIWQYENTRRKPRALPFNPMKILTAPYNAGGGPSPHPL
jgi:hypothetical protein